MTTFTDGFGGDVQTYIDTFVSIGSADDNFGALEYVQIYYTTYQEQISLLKFDLSSIPDGATVSSAKLYLYQHGWGTGAYTATIHRILAANSAWTEADATWNYAVESSTRWEGDVGDNGGTDAGCSVSGTDFNATSMGTLSGNGDNAVGTEYEINLDTDQIETMLTADYGLVIFPTAGTGVQYLYSSDDATTGYRPKLVIEYSEEISGTTCWGHVTGVTETNVQTFAGNWTGDGEIGGAGDGETICLNAGEYMESEVVNTGDMYVELLQNEYAAGDTIAIKYRTGATVVACQAADWTAYTVPFLSLGYSQVRVESTL